MDKLERELVESKSQLEELERNTSLKKEAFNQWVTETDAAILEARQSTEAREHYLKSLQTNIQQYQVIYILQCLLFFP